MTEENKPIHPVHEGGKAVTVEPSDGRVALIVWRKNGGVLLPFCLTKTEARELARQLLDAT